MYNPNEPDIFGGDITEQIADGEPFKKAQTDILELSESEFLYSYKATKYQYQALISAVKELHKASDALSEMTALAIDPEILDNTSLLLEDYARLLGQMHSANYWQNEGE